MDFQSNYAMTIGGEAVDGGARFDVLNPANAQAFASAPDATREQLDQAVAAARQAFAGWAATPIDTRREKLRALGAALMQHEPELSRLLSREQGKPVAEATAEIQAAAWFLDGYAGIDIPVEVAEDDADRRVETHRVPVGVVGAIAPWNFPVMLAIFKLGPALVTGNTIVLKPSPFTPLTTLKLGEIASEIFPAGVINIISGGDALGPWMTSHPGFDKVSFTGSTQTGRKVLESAASTLKRVTLELGGNDAAIVLDDVDVDQVAQQLFWSAFGNNGQICVATKRMYIHKDVYEPLRDAIAAYARTVKVGDGAEQGSQLGPINNRPQYERVIDLIRDTREKGYALAVSDGAIPDEGYFVPVTIVDNPPEGSRIVQEEQFGPVLPLIRVDSVEDAVARANASEYGLAGSVWSGSTERATEVAQRLATGTVWINSLQYITPRAAFGGHKQSGFGVEGGLEGLLEFTLPRTLVIPKTPASA